MAKTVLLHHPQIRKEIRRGPRLAALLKKQSGWREGPLPPKTEPAPVTPAGEQDEPAAKAPAKKTAESTGKSEGK